MPLGPPLSKMVPSSYTGELLEAVATSLGFTVTLIVELLVQPQTLVTTTLIVAVPALIAFHAIVLVSLTPVIIPCPVTDQEYEAPGPASGTEAVCPVDSAQTADGAVMAESGRGFTMTFVELLSVVPMAFVMVSV
jgi:hypothetical protein